MDLKELKITSKCCDWLAPLVVDSDETSYEQSAIDAVLNRVKKMETALVKIAQEEYGNPSGMMVIARKALREAR